MASRDRLERRLILVTRRTRPPADTARAAIEAVLPSAAVTAARAAIAAWDGYEPTPLVDMPRLAQALELGAVLLKHEGARFPGVDSFKALGPAYALQRAVERRAIAPGDRSAWTAIAATSGNHGRAVAWAARRLGLRARIFMPAHTSPGRAAAIAALGAAVERVPGSFDDALAAALDAAEQPRRIVVADVPRPGAEAIAADTLAGYGVLGDELADAQERYAATHVVVAAGNGSLAAATVARLVQRLGSSRPAVISAEPRASDVVRRSLAADAPLQLGDPGASVMDGLVVGAPAPLAWPILAAGLDAAVAIDDAVAIDTLRRLATGRDGDAPVACGETGIAAVAAVVAAAQERAALGLGPRSRVVAVVCEGVTDRAVVDALLRDRG